MMKVKVTEGSVKARTGSVPDLNSTLTRITMMRMETEQLVMRLMNQHNQCIQPGRPISFINSLTPVSFS